MFAILLDWLRKGERSDRFKKKTKASILSQTHGELTLETHRSDVFLYHLRILQILEQSQKDGDIRAYHFALLRQLLENISSFLGVGHFSYVLNSIMQRKWPES